MPVPPLLLCTSSFKFEYAGLKFAAWKQLIFQGKGTNDLQRSPMDYMLGFFCK